MMSEGLENVLKPSLPPNLKVIEERSSQSDLHCVFVLTEADLREFLISLMRCGLPYYDNFTPDNIGWITHSLVVPLMRVGIVHLMMCLHHLRQTSLANPTRAHLEGQLTDNDMHFTGQHLADFMAKVGSFKKNMYF